MPYTRTQIALHWAIVLLLLVQFLTGEAMGAAFDRLLETGQRAPGGTGLAHMLLGATVLGLAIVRTLVRRRHGAPPPTPQSPPWDVTLSRLNHGALYVMLWLTPILGLAAWLTAVEGLGNLHELAKTLLLALAALHVLGALYHQLFLRDGLIRRMLVPGARS